ncbi:MAG: EamA family transporter [Nitrospirota bacterium]
MTSRPAMPAPAWLILLAYLTVYLIWGSTYLAIRFGIETMPPSLLFAERFLLAGVLNFALYRAVTAWRGQSPLAPTRVQVRNAALIGCLLLVGGTGLVGWAEQTVDSHLAALIISSTPLWVAAWDQRFVRRRSASWPQITGMMLGVVGIAVLTGTAGDSSGSSGVGIALLLLAACCWSGASSASHVVDLPRDVLLTSSIQMLAGGAAFLILGAVMGEITPSTVTSVGARSWWAMWYLTVFGSTVAFTAFAWLLTVEPAHRVASYALVNPIVAVGLGAWLGHETVGPRVWIALPLIGLGLALHLLTADRTRRTPRAMVSRSSSMPAERG